MSYRGKKVSIVITSCKRLHLLRRTICALSACCEDIGIVDEILFFDDRSSLEERREMLRLFGEYLTGIQVHYIFFGEYSFKSEFHNYLHAMVLNTVRNRLIEMNSDYYLHLEDDYQYMTSFRISDSVDVLMKSDEHAYVCHYQNWKHFPKEYNIKWVDNFWEWYYDVNLPVNVAMFDDKILALQEATLSPHEYVHRTWIRYQNWPHYSLRPGIHDVKKFLSFNVSWGPAFQTGQTRPTETMSNGLNYKCQYDIVPISDINTLTADDVANINNALDKLAVSL